MANSKFALQLSTREGFEVKVSEALHAAKPVIASRTGGIPLQIEDGKSGFLCDVGDNDAVAKHMYDLYTDEDLYDTMSEYARTHVSDEVGTVGNAEHKNIVIGKAGRSRWLGRKPHQRGSAMNPVDHPHGGGEGRTGAGRVPVTPWGKPTKGLKTRRKRKTSDRFIVTRRK